MKIRIKKESIRTVTYYTQMRSVIFCSFSGDTSDTLHNIHLKSHYNLSSFLSKKSIRTSYFKSQCNELKESGQILPFRFFSTNLRQLHTSILLKIVFVRIEAECHDQLVILLCGHHLVSNDGRQMCWHSQPPRDLDFSRMDSNEEEMFHTHSINISSLATHITQYTVIQLFV